MADFFTRLAEHTLGLTPTVQPVIAPLFAPSALERGGRAAPDRSLAIEEIAAPDLSAGAYASRAPEPSPLSAFQPLVVSREMPEAEPAFPHLPKVPRALEEQAVRRTFQPLLPPAAETEGVQAARLFSSEAKAGARPPLVPRFEQGEQRVSAPFSTPETRGDALASQTARRARGENAEARQAETRSIPPAYAKPVTTAPIQQPAAPPIHVSIGRIEVRALHPPAPAPARPQPARPTPALSLDAYLQQQKGKQR